MNRLQFDSVVPVGDIFEVLESDNSTWTVIGEVIIRNEAREQIDSFKVKLLFNPALKKRFPKVADFGNSIPCKPERHVNGDGTFCLTVVQREIILCSRGLGFAQFIESVLYPYMVNQSLLNSGDISSFVMGEYDHNEAGILEFYRELLPDMRPEQMRNMISFAGKNRISKRLNIKCPCGSYRNLNYCHYNQLLELQILGVDRLEEDMIILDKIISIKE